MPHTIAVAGHICLDLIPDFASGTGGGLPAPGELGLIGPLVMGTGGAVANTGLALHRLGIEARLLGLVGQDSLGQIVASILNAEKPGMGDALPVSGDAGTSYTIVMNPPGIDRSFFHYPGLNACFGARHVPRESISGAALFHFGYPTLMRNLYLEHGAGMKALFAQAHAAGTATSLDMAMPDPEGESGKVDWRAWLAHVLPETDVFVPSYDELLMMVDAGAYAAWREDEGRGAEAIRLDSVRDHASELLAMGPAVVLLKLGERGLYLKTAPPGPAWDTLERALAPHALDPWKGQEMHAGVFDVEVKGTTGAGDTAVAGFLASLARGLGPAESLCTASAVGACCVECLEALGGVRDWEATQARIRQGWSLRAIHPAGSGWAPAGAAGVRRREA